MTDPATLHGIHHVTAICGDPQRNLDFYSGLLGLRLVKRTVNFDDPGTWHLYYGDRTGTPGTLLTFFAWTGLPPMVTAQGRDGAGQIVATALRIPGASLDFWVDRLAAAGIDFEGPGMRLGQPVLAFHDPDDLKLELVAEGEGGPGRPWTEGPVPAEHAIGGVAGVALCLPGFERTAAVLTDTLGFRRGASDGSLHRFHAGEGAGASRVDLTVQPGAVEGRMGIGVAHHVAWRTPSRARQERWREVVVAGGLDVTPVLDRRYFESIYFREPGGVLFEIATDPPGFTVDEGEAELGTALKLPPWLEPRRDRIEARLPVLEEPGGRRRPPR